MKRSGTADLPLHGGHVPQWLAERMAKLGLAITEAIITEWGTAEMLRRLSDPFWFQSFGAVMGMDWHSSGITTSVMGALKRAINPQVASMGIYICGGKGKQSRQTPIELLKYSDKTGVDGNALVRYSKLSAKVDNTAVQDGFQLYHHNFIFDTSGDWTVVQQGMSQHSATARRYHWHSAGLKSFVEAPHTGVCGVNQGKILNLVAAEAGNSRQSVLSLSEESPEKVLQELRHLQMPAHHDVRAEDVDLKRLGAMLWLTREQRPANFEGLLLLEGMGPRTLQSMALVSEIIYGTPARFDDPARFSFAHGGKDGHPFPVPIKVFDETIAVLGKAVEKAKIGQSDKLAAIRKLSELSVQAETSFTPNQNFEAVIERERAESWKYGGRTIFGKAKPPKPGNSQLTLF